MAILNLTKNIAKRENILQNTTSFFNIKEFNVSLFKELICMLETRAMWKSSSFLYSVIGLDSHSLLNFAGGELPYFLILPLVDLLFLILLNYNIIQDSSDLLLFTPTISLASPRHTIPKDDNLDEDVDSWLDEYDWESDSSRNHDYIPQEEDNEDIDSETELDSGLFEAMDPPQDIVDKEDHPTVDITKHNFDNISRCLEIEIMNSRFYSGEYLVDALYNSLFIHPWFLRYGNTKIMFSLAKVQEYSEIDEGFLEFNEENDSGAALHANCLVWNTMTRQQFHRAVSPFWVNTGQDTSKYGEGIPSEITVRLWNPASVLNANIKNISLARSFEALPPIPDLQVNSKPLTPPPY